MLLDPGREIPPVLLAERFKAMGQNRAVPSLEEVEELRSLLTPPRPEVILQVMGHELPGLEETGLILPFAVRRDLPSSGILSLGISEVSIPTF